MSARSDSRQAWSTTDILVANVDTLTSRYMCDDGYSVMATARSQNLLLGKEFLLSHESYLDKKK